MEYYKSFIKPSVDTPIVFAEVRLLPCRSFKKLPERAWKGIKRKKLL